jgi:pimeloyl-ACP methyl ester carboxylesterase
MQTVASADGTVIAYEQNGAGEPVVLISGAMCDHLAHAPLAQLLASRYRVFNYDRRARGASGGTHPAVIDQAAVAREIEDLAAVLAAAGGSAAVFGASSGAVLGLRAAAAGLPVTALVMWEPPFMSDPDKPRQQQQYVAELSELIESDRRGDAVALFMRSTGMPEDMITGARQSPWWSSGEGLAPSLAYDAAAMGNGMLPVPVASAVTIPTLVLHGDSAWAGPAAHATAAALPNGKLVALPGQSHNFNPAVLTPEIIEFLNTSITGH